MHHLKNICLLSVLAGLLVFAGCSSDEETSLLDPVQSQPEAATGQYADFSQVLQDHGVQSPTIQGGDKMIPLPTPLTFAAMASSAKQTVTSGSWWGELTRFVTGNKKYKGYEIGWLEDIPEEPDPNAFYCYYFMDIPVDLVGRLRDVDPNTQWIDTTIDRVGDVLTNHPELATDRVYRSDDTWLFYYEFKYPVGDSFNVFKMFLVRLYIQE